MPLLKSAFVIRLAPGCKNGCQTALQPQITSFACDEIYRLTSIPHATESERTLVAITFNIRAEEKNGLQPSMGIVFRDVSQDVQVEQIKDRLISVVAHELKLRLRLCVFRQKLWLRKLALEKKSVPRFCRICRTKLFGCAALLMTGLIFLG